MELRESGVVFTMACDKNKTLAGLSIVLLQNVLNFPAENKVKLQPHSVLGRLGLPSSPPGLLACDETIHRQGAGFQRYFLTPELRTPCRGHPHFSFVVFHRFCAVFVVFGLVWSVCLFCFLLGYQQASLSPGFPLLHISLLLSPAVPEVCRGVESVRVCLCCLTPRFPTGSPCLTPPPPRSSPGCAQSQLIYRCELGMCSSRYARFPM